MLLTGLAGIGVAGFSGYVTWTIRRTATLGTITVDGQRVPLAAVEPGVGLYVGIVGGAVVTLAALAGIVGSILRS